MSEHQFSVGQNIAATGAGVPPGPYQIGRLLPVADGVPQYRAKSVVDQHERALPETAMRLVLRRSEPVLPAKRKAANR